MLKIDLLPARIPRARTNKKILALLGLLLIAALLGFGFLMTTAQTKLAAANVELQKATEEANKVTAIESETQAIQSRLQPIADKVKFCEQADECGYPYWERFFAINEFIYGGAEMRFFGIMSRNAPGLVGDGSPEALYHQAGPAGTDCAFAVRVKNTNEFGRFILNLIRCPEISDIRIQGAVPGGRVITARWPQILQQWNLPNFGIPTGAIQGLALGAGAPAAAGGAPGGMPGEGAMGPGGEPMPAEVSGGPMGGAPGGGAAPSGLTLQPRLDGSVDILVTCQLVHPIMVPQPASGAAAAPAAAGPGPAGPGPGPGPEGAPPVDSAGPPGAGAKGGGESAPPPKKGGGDEEGGGGGGLKGGRDAGGGDE